MKQGELNFFKGTVLSKSKEDIFMCSDMPMEDMAKDIDFGKKWMFAIAMCLKKGHHLNIIHNLDRPFNEMMLGLESWIPIYMAGQISPYYLSNLKNNIYNHLNYVSAAAALSGECINGFHNKGMYYLTTNKNEIEYYKEKSDLLLKKAKPLMEIYRESNIKEYHLFLKKDENIECDRTRYISSLPLFTISDELLIKILKRNKLTKEEIDKIIKYKNNEFKYMNSILKKNKVFDYIYVIKEDEFISDTPSLLLNNLFIDKTINYTYKEYIEHLKLTNEYAKNNKNYNILTEKDSDVLDYFGLEEDEKGIHFCLVTRPTWKTVKKGLQTELKIDVPGTGIVFLIPLSSIGGKHQLKFMLGEQEFEKGEETTLKETKHELIIAIANYGYNTQVMRAAEEGGATGGTVFHGKGVGMKRGEQFLGVSLVSEKEIIFIVTKTEQKNAIMKSIMEKAGIGTKAGTIAFSLPVTSTAGLRIIEDSGEYEEI